MPRSLLRLSSTISLRSAAVVAAQAIGHPTLTQAAGTEPFNSRCFVDGVQGWRGKSRTIQCARGRS